MTIAKLYSACHNIASDTFFRVYQSANAYYKDDTPWLLGGINEIPSNVLHEYDVDRFMILDDGDTVNVLVCEHYEIDNETDDCPPSET